MGAKVNHKRIKPKYNPVPNDSERKHHLHLIEEHGCICCGRKADVVHHPLTRHPDQRWRRDHLYVVPMTADCHTGLHRNGNEAAWCKERDIDMLHEVNFYRMIGVIGGIL